MKKIFFFSCVFSGCARGALFGQFVNVLISDANEPEEVSICINPKNTNQIVAAANIDNYFYSDDGGVNWEVSRLADSVNGVWGDPIIFTDTTGAFFYSHLSNPPFQTSGGSWVDRIVFTKSTDGGAGWWPVGSTTGKNGSKVQDKEGVVVNQANNEIYVTWTQFDQYGSANPLDSSVILFSKSMDAGVSWSLPIRISKHAGDCVDDDNTVEGAIPAVGANGEIFVVWTGPTGFVLNKSMDQGVSWMDEEIAVVDMPGGWNYTIGGLQRCNGLPQLKTDLSGGPNHGTLYLNWTDQRNGSDDTDVWLLKSIDGGVSWTEPFRVNDDGIGNQQFLTWMDVDQVTGYLYCVFYDRRNHSSGSNLTDVYLAVSVDGGVSFSNQKINEFSFLPSEDIFFGDYIGVSAYNHVVRPIWMASNLSQLSVWTALIDGNTLGWNNSHLNAHSPVDLQQNAPNPFRQITCIKFRVAQRSQISLTVRDVLGNTVVSLLEKEWFREGDYDYVFNATAHGLPAGIYYYTIDTSETALSRKMVVY